MHLSVIRLGYWTRMAERGYPQIKYWNSRTSRTQKPETIIRQWSDELLIGNVVKTSTIGLSQLPCAQVAVTRNELNSYFNMYFPNTMNFWALDDREVAGSKGLCAMGDMVLMRKLTEPYTLKVTHRIEKLVFQHGHVIDPLSGKRIYGPEYEEMRKVRENIVNRVIGQRLTARQLAATKLHQMKVEMRKEMKGPQ